MEQYTKYIELRTARPRSERLRQLGSTVSKATSVASATSVPSVIGGGHSHQNLKDLDRMFLQNGYLLLEETVVDEKGDEISAPEKVKAGFADMAKMNEKGHVLDWFIPQEDGSLKLNPSYTGVWAEGFGAFGGKAGEGGDTPGGGGSSFEYVYTWHDLESGMSEPADTNNAVFNAAAVWNVYHAIDTRIQQLIGAAPEALDTLEEIADRLADDSDAIAAINGVLEGKASQADVTALEARVFALETAANIWLIQQDGSVKLNPTYIGVWAEGFGSFGGKTGASGGGEGGGIQFDYVYGVSDLGGAVVSDDTGVFNADATNHIYDLVTGLQTTTTSLSSNVTALTTTVGGHTTEIAALQTAVAAIDWFTIETVNSRPTLKLNTKYDGLWADGFGAFGGKHTSPSGGSGSGFDYIYTRSDLGGTVVSDDTGVFNADATNYIYSLVTALQTTTNALSGNLASNYYTKTQIDSIVSQIDVSDQLANYLPLNGGTMNDGAMVTLKEESSLSESETVLAPGAIKLKDYSDNYSIELNATNPSISIIRGGYYTSYAYGYVSIKNSSGSPKTISFPDKSGTFALTSDLPTALSDLTDDVVSGHYLSLNGGAMNNKNLVGNMNAEYLGGYESAKYLPVTAYNHTDGTLVKIAPSTSNRSLLIKIEGRHHATFGLPVLTYVQLYWTASSATFTHRYALRVGRTMGTITALVSGGYLCLWFKQTASYNAYRITVYSGSYSYNYINSVSNAAFPADATSVTEIPESYVGAGTYLPLAGGTMVGDILAGTDSTYNLGSLTAGWNNLYVWNISSTPSTSLKFMKGGVEIARINNLGFIPNLTFPDDGVSYSASLGRNAAPWRSLYVSDQIVLGTPQDTTIGAAALEWDATNKAWHLLGNFYADGFISAGGLGNDEEEAHSYLDHVDIDESRLTNGDLLTWNGSNWVRIPQSSVRPDLTDYALLSDLPTNLSELTDDIGVATQTWVNANYALKSDVTGYLPLTGGTMTGAITLPAPSGGAKANAALIWSANTRIGGTAAEDLGLYAGNSIYLRPGGSTTLGVILSTSRFTYNGNDVWHTGNLVNPARTYNSYTGTAASVPYIKVSITNTSEWRASFLVNFYCRYTHRLLVISGVNSASTTGWSYPGASCLAYGGYSPKDSVDVVFGYDSDDELWFAIPGDTAGGYARLSVSDCASGRVLQEDVDFSAIRVTSYEGLATGNGAIQSTVSAIKPTTDVSRADVAYLKKAWEGDTDRTATGWYRIGQFNGTIKSAELTLGCTYSNIGNAYVKLLIRGSASAQLQIIQLAASRVTGFNRVRCVPTGTQYTYYVDVYFANNAARNAWSLYYPNDGRAFTPADSLTLITDEVTSSIEHPISATSSSLPLLLDNGAGVSARAADESSVNLARITTANNIVIGDYASDIWVYGDTSFKALLGSNSGPFIQLDSTAMLTVRGVTSSSPSILLQRGSTSDNYIDWKISNTAGNLLFASGTTSLVNRLYLNKDTLRPYDNAGLELGAAGHYWSSLYSNRVYLAAGVYLEYDSAHGGIHVVGGGLYSDSFLAAGGLAEEDESSSNDKLTDLLDVNIDPTALSAGDMIKWSGAQWVKISQSEIQPNPAVFATRDWVESQGYLVGSDLSGYVTSQQLNSALAGYVTTYNFQQALDDYYSSSEVDDALDELEYNLGLRIDDKIDGMTLTGDVTGSGGDSVVTTIANGAVTNAKIANPYMTIAGEDVALGGTISVATLKTNLGVSEIEGYFVNGNARYAVALANPHTFWGQTFNGTQNVSGAMSNVGTITPGSNNSYTLGTSSRKWSNIYATAGNIASVTSTTVTTTNLAVETISPKGSGTCVYFDGGDVALINGYDLLLSSTSKIELGPAIFEYDSVNKMVHVYGTDGGVPIGFYSDGPGAFGGLTNSGGDSGASSYLADLLDVNVSGASSGQYLMYNGAQWVPATVSGGGEPIDTSAFVQSIRFNSQLYLPNASGLVDLPSVSGGTEWFNIHVKYQGSSSDTEVLTKIWTVVENYDSKLLNDNNYRMVLLRWRRSQTGRTGWKAAMLSDPSSDNAISYYAWWPITGRMAEWWDNLGSNNSGQVFYDCISTAKKRNQPTHFKSTGTSHYRVAVAIYKYTGEGTYGWHRVSNIAGIDMRGTSSGGTDYRTMQFD